MAQRVVFEFPSLVPSLHSKLTEKTAYCFLAASQQRQGKSAYKKQFAQLVHSPVLSGPGCWYPH